MKNLILLFLCALITIFSPESALSAVKIDSTSFPDGNFRSYVSKNFDKDRDGILSDDEIESATGIYVSKSGISSLKGIEYFSSLTFLDCSLNNLTELDVGCNTALTTLLCGGNKLATLDLSGNTDLESLSVNYQNIAGVKINNTSDVSYPYQLDFRTIMPEEKLVWISELEISAWDNNGHEISTSYENGILHLSAQPSMITYGYRTGYIYSSRYNMFVIIEVKMPSVKPLIITKSLPDCVIGTAYSTMLEADGLDSVAWTISKGPLPYGLKLSSSGILNGVPTKAGKFSFTVRASNIHGSDTESFTLNVYTPPSVITGSLSDGIVNKSYSFTFKASGTKPIIWASDGLPSGLTLTTNGELKGKFTDNGIFNFFVTAKNGAGEVKKAFTLAVRDVAPKIMKSKLPEGKIGVSYSFIFKASGTGIIKWGLDGSLPDGIVFDTETGTLSGTPTEAWNGSVSVTAENSGGKTSKVLKFTIKGTAPKILTEALSPAVLNQNYNVSMDVNGTPAITFDVSGLPGGLKFIDRRISGVPTQSGRFKVLIKAANIFGTALKKFTLTVMAPPEITTASLIDGTEGKPYSGILKAVGTAPVTWSIESGLPSGLKFDSKKGTIKGKPSVSGTFDLTVSAKNDVEENFRTFLLVINAAKPVLSGNLAKGIVGEPYSSKLKATGTGPISWHIEGKLPEGISFQEGTFSGIPVEVWNGNIKITASNSGGDCTRDFKLIVKTGSAKKITLPDMKYMLDEVGNIDVGDSVLEETFASNNNNHEGALELLSESECEASRFSCGYMIAAILPDTIVSDDGQYDFKVELDDSVPVGAKLIWLASPKNAEPSDDDEIVDFTDENGSEIYTVPESRFIIVSPWLNAGVTYAPKIAVELGAK